MTGVTLHPVAEGLAIEPIAAPAGNFTLTLDLCRHAIVLRVADGERDLLPLDLGSVAALHRCLIDMLKAHDLLSNFNGRPNEIPDAPPFAEDIAPRQYRPARSRLQGIRGRNDRPITTGTSVGESGGKREVSSARLKENGNQRSRT